jgi:hypothetical protein
MIHHASHDLIEINTYFWRLPKMPNFWSFWQFTKHPWHFTKLTWESLLAFAAIVPKHPPPYCNKQVNLAAWLQHMRIHINQISIIHQPWLTTINNVQKHSFRPATTILGGYNFTSFHQDLSELPEPHLHTLQFTHQKETLNKNYLNTIHTVFQTLTTNKWTRALPNNLKRCSAP